MKKSNYLELLISVILILTVAWSISLFREPEKSKPMTGVAIESSTPVDERFILIIPKIDVETPIIPDVPGNNKETYNKSLENGVAHYLGTGKPGEGKNIFIFGHSSNYPWAPGNFKEIFRSLSRLNMGDEITILYQGKEFKYKVVEEKTVKPTQTDVLTNPGEGEQLTLMTCTPLGTTLNRLIIIAKPIIN